MRGREAEGLEDKLPETARKSLAQGETARNQDSVMPLTLSKEAARNAMVEAAMKQGRSMRPLETAGNHGRNLNRKEEMPERTVDAARNMMEAAGNQGRNVNREKSLEIARNMVEAAGNQDRRVNREKSLEAARNQGRNVNKVEDKNIGAALCETARKLGRNMNSEQGGGDAWESWRYSQEHGGGSWKPG